MTEAITYFEEHHTIFSFQVLAPRKLHIIGYKHVILKKLKISHSVPKLPRNQREMTRTSKENKQTHKQNRIRCVKTRGFGINRENIKQFIMLQD